MLSPKLRRSIIDHLHSFDDNISDDEMRELFTTSNQLLVQVLEENSKEKDFEGFNVTHKYNSYGVKQIVITL